MYDSIDGWVSQEEGSTLVWQLVGDVPLNHTGVFRSPTIAGGTLRFTYAEMHPLFADEFCHDCWDTDCQC